MGLNPWHPWNFWHLEHILDVFEWLYITSIQIDLSIKAIIQSIILPYYTLGESIFLNTLPEFVHAYHVIHEIWAMAANKEQ